MHKQNILILEPDRDFTAQLVRALNRTGSFTISVVSTVKEACLHLVQTHKDLAFIPVNEGAKIIRSLRAIQPDLRLILVTPTADVEIPVTYSGRVQGVLIKGLLAVELPTILEQAITQPFFIRESPKPYLTRSRHMLDTAVLVSTLHQANLGHLIQTIALSRGAKLLAYWGELNEREAATVTLHVGRSWSEKAQPVRIQFTHLPARAGDLLLYTHRIHDDYLLTLIALPETPISNCRRQAAQLIPKLTPIISGQRDSAVQALAHAANNFSSHGRISYVIVWRPIEPLSDSLKEPLRQALLRLATTNGCVLTHIYIHADIIHIVATCPPERDTTWAAYLFKSGSEQIIQQEYGVVVTLWEPGYYAAESTKPLNQAELNIFLEHITLN